MTPLGTFIFSAIGALFVAGVALVIWLALRDAGAMIKALESDGWSIERHPSSRIAWSARRVKAGVATRIEVSTGGGVVKGGRTSVRMDADTGTDDVLVEGKAPGFLAADGALASVVEFKPPPRWSGGSPAFVADYTAYASDENAASRWLSETNQNAIIEYHHTAPRKVPIRFFQGALETHWAGEPRDAAQIEGVVALFERLRRAGAARRL